MFRIFLNQISCFCSWKWVFKGTENKCYFEKFSTMATISRYFSFKSLSKIVLPLSWRRPLSSRHQSIDLQNSPDSGPRHERVNRKNNDWCFWTEMNLCKISNDSDNTIRFFSEEKAIKLLEFIETMPLDTTKERFIGPLLQYLLSLRRISQNKKNTPAQVSLQYYQATHHTNFVFNCLLYGIMSTEIRIIWYIKMTRKNNYKKTVSGSSKPQKRKKNLVVKVCLA